MSSSPEENQLAERVATPNPSQLQAHYGWGLLAWMKIKGVSLGKLSV